MPTPLVFISYTEPDVETALAIAQGLARRGVAYFFDREHSEPGESIEAMIERGLGQTTHFLYLATPHSLTGWSRAEAGSANELAINGKLTFVPGLLGVTRHELPMLLRNWVPLPLDDLETALDRLTTTVKKAAACAAQASGPALGELRGVPPLPPHYEPRPEHLGAIRGLLLTGGGRVGVGSPSGGLGMHGMGGIGKTVLATAIARDEAVRAAFPDGVCWVTVGRETGPLEVQLTLARMLGEERPAFTTLQEGAERLRALLGGRRVLVVLDDVWTAGALEAVSAVEAPAALLVTSRMEDLMRAGGLAVHGVQEMGDDEADRLLARHLNVAVEELPAAGRALARRLGNLPLALAIGGSGVRRDGPLAARLDAIRRDVEAVDHSGLERELPCYSQHRTVFDSLAASLNALPSATADAFLDLAVFPEDTPVPLPVLARLWGSDGRALRLADALADAALARYDARGRLTLHDLQRDFAVFRAGDSAPARHRRLTAAYRAACGGARGGLEDDGYVFHHLPWHLHHGGEAEALHALLLDCDWIAAKLAATGPNGFEADGRLADDRLSDAAEVQRVCATLTRAAHVLAEDAGQLPVQLWGRLSPEDGPGIAALLNRAAARAPRPWLKPRWPSMATSSEALIRTMEGGALGVPCVALMADGRRCVAGTTRGTIGVWEVDTGTLVRTLGGEEVNRVTSIAVAADGPHAASGFDDGTVGVWDLENGVLLRSFKAHSGEVTSVALTPDGRLALSACGKDAVRLWNVDSGRCLGTLEGSDGAPAVAVSADGRYALSTSQGKAVQLWDLGRGASVRSFTGHVRDVLSIAMTPDGRFAVSGDQKGVVRVWNVETGVLLHTLEGHTDWVRALAITPDGRCAVSGADDHTVRVWDLESGTLLRTLDGATGWVMSVAVTPDGWRVISSSRQGNRILLWDLTRREGTRRHERMHARDVYAVATVPGGRHSLSVSEDGSARLWDVKDGELLRIITKDMQSVVAAAVTPDGRRAVSGHRDRRLQVWDLEAGRSLCTLRGHTALAITVCMTADARRVVSGYSDRTLCVWDMENATLLHALAGHTSLVRAAAISPNGRYILSTSFDDTVRLWDAEQGTLIRILAKDVGYVNAVAFLDDSCALLGASSGSIHLWDVGRDASLGLVKGHGGWVLSLTATPDGRHVLSTSDDKTVRLWDLAAGHELARVRLDDSARAVAIDGTTIVVGDNGGNVHVFDLITDPPDPS